MRWIAVLGCLLAAGCSGSQPDPGGDTDTEQVIGDPDSVIGTDTDDSETTFETGWGDNTDAPEDTDTQPDPEDTSPTPGPDTGPVFEDTSVCPFGERPDCDGICYPTYFIGDGNCDDGASFQSNFDCVAHAFDGGDCDDHTGVIVATGCSFTVHIRTEAWGNEVGWRLVEQGGGLVSQIATGTYTNTRDFYHPVQMDTGSYTFEMIDSFGDGWHGGFFEVINDTTGLIEASGALPLGAFGQVDFDVDCSDTATQPPVDTGPPPDCQDYTLVVNTVAWGAEIGFSLTDDRGNTLFNSPTGALGDNASYTYNFSLPDGYYTFGMTDSFGDGWNGGTYTILDGGGNVVASGGLIGGFSGEDRFIADCTDTFNPEPIPPGGDAIEADCSDLVFVLETLIWANETSFEFWNTSSNILVLATQPNSFANNQMYTWDVQISSGAYRVDMHDSFGDGWHNGTWSLYDRLNDIVIVQDTLATGAFGESAFNLDCTTEIPSGFDHTGGCAPGAVEDCTGTCWPISYIGDGSCDDGTIYAADFACAPFSYDEGDCTAP